MAAWDGFGLACSSLLSVFSKGHLLSETFDCFDVYQTLPMLAVFPLPFSLLAGWLEMSDKTFPHIFHIFRRLSALPRGRVADLITGFTVSALQQIDCYKCNLQLGHFCQDTSDKLDLTFRSGSQKPMKMNCPEQCAAFSRYPTTKCPVRCSPGPCHLSEIVLAWCELFLIFSHRFPLPPPGFC